MPVYTVRRRSSGREVASLFAMDSECAGIIAHNRTVSRIHPDDIFIELDPKPKPNAEREARGFAWANGESKQ